MKKNLDLHFTPLNCHIFSNYSMSYINLALDHLYKSGT